jgi:hypothetical protein
MLETGLCPFETQSVSISGTTARTAAACSTKRVRLLTTTDCFVVFGNSSVTATTAGMPLQANAPEYFDMSASGHTHVAAITSSGTGTLYVSAM